MNLSKYKSKFKEMGISQKEVADYTGYYRESMTLILNGSFVSEKRGKHLMEEFDELIAKVKKKTSTTMPEEFYFGDIKFVWKEQEKIDIFQYDLQKPDFLNIVELGRIVNKLADRLK